LTTVLPASTQIVTKSLPGQTIVFNQTLPASTQYITQTEREQASTQYITQTEREPGSTQYITRTESQAVSTYYETITISLEAITRTLTETSVALSFSPVETTITGESSALDAKLSCGINMLKYTSSDIVPQQHGDIAYLYNIYNN
jgi:hypothetical protein